MPRSSWLQNLFPTLQFSGAAQRRRGRPSRVTHIEGLESRALLTEVQTLVAGIVHSDQLTTDEDVSITANVVTGTNGATADTFEGPVTLISVTQPAHGTATFLADGTVTYVPIADFNGTDHFDYTVDTGDGTQTATVTITVAPVVDASSDIIIGSKNLPLTVNELTGEGGGVRPDEFEGPAVISSVTQGQHGTVTFLPDGTVTYTPDHDFLGEDFFFYRVTAGGVEESAKVFVFINPLLEVNPDALITPADTAIVANLITGTNGATADVHADDGALTAVTQPAHGTVTFLADGTITYTPEAGFVGTDTFTYTVTIPSDSNTAEVTVQVGQGIRATDDRLTINEDTPITVNVITGTNGASADFSATPAVLTGVTQPQHGTVTFQPDGTITYTPDTDFFGSDYFVHDSFEYTIAGGGGTDTGVVAFTVLPVDDIVEDLIFTYEGAAITANVITGTNGASADNFEGPVTLQHVDQGQYGTVTFLPDGTITYTPMPGFSGEDLLRYEIGPGPYLEVGHVRIKINPVGLATADAFDINEDSPITANLILGTNGATPDIFGVPVTMRSVTQPEHGTVTFQPDGTITYAPDADFNGTDEFDYEVIASGTVQSAHVIMRVHAVADIVADSVATVAGVPATFNLITGTGGASADNFEGTATLASVTQTTNGTVTLLVDGSVTYTPNAGFVGEDSFTYTVLSGGVNETANVAITVTAATDAAVITLNPQTGTYHLGRATAFVDPKATFTTALAGSADFSQAVLTVSVTAGQTKKTVLSIRPKGDDAGEINLSGKKVRYGSTVIGTYQGGKGKSPDLVVALNANATAAAVEDLIQRINYQNKEYVSEFTVQMQLTNVSGQNSNVATRNFVIPGPTTHSARRDTK